jgi:hypothetical protein
MLERVFANRPKLTTSSVSRLIICFATISFSSTYAQTNNTGQSNLPTPAKTRSNAEQHLRYTWLKHTSRSSINASENRLEARIQAPAASKRVPLEIGSFGDWLRGLPLKRAHEPVRFFNGHLKPNQRVHESVVDIDIGAQDLQQCADSLIRLRAEYLYSQTPRPEIAFHYTSGHRVSFSKWAKGFRPVLTPPNKSPKKRWTMAWKLRAKPSETRKSFNAYLKSIFSYAGTMSLSRHLPKRQPEDIEVGDIYLEGGFPGHTVMVVDKVIHAAHGPLILIAQGFMPAQSLHILKNTQNQELSPWFKVPQTGRFHTPEFTFNATDLYYFND